MLNKVWLGAVLFFVASCGGTKETGKSVTNTSDSASVDSVASPDSRTSGEATEIVGKWKITEVTIDKLPSEIPAEALSPAIQKMKEQGSIEFKSDSTYISIDMDGKKEGTWKSDWSARNIYLVSSSKTDTLSIAALTEMQLKIKIGTPEGIKFTMDLMRFP